jgi:hypothetical protein
MMDCISREATINYFNNFRKKISSMPLMDVVDRLKELPSVTPQEPTIKALGEELRKARKGIADEKVLIGYNMAIAICNKHLGESENKE